MDRTTTRTLAGFAALLGLLLFAVPAKADFTVSYCSSQNTAGDFSAMHEQYQSNGWCHDECIKKGTYAFAIVQWTDCWCSNYIPEDQEDTGECDQKCPGYPTEMCGNQGKDLFTYVELNGAPSGTQGTSKPTSANPSSAPPSPPPIIRTSRDPETVVKTVTAPPAVVTLTATPVTPSDPASSDRPSKTAAPTTLETSGVVETSAAKPQTSVVVITESGQVVTHTVVSTPSSALVVDPNQRKGTNVGAIAGGVVGGVAVMAAVVGGIFFLLWRRRRQQQQDDEGTSGVQRNTSTMSKAGLLRGEKAPQYPPPIATSFNKRQSRTMLDNESISPISGSDRRNSRPFVFDQRLNPSAIMFNDNSSRVSVGTLDDSRDYHRTLGVRNPDINSEQN